MIYPFSLNTLIKKQTKQANLQRPARDPDSGFPLLMCKDFLHIWGEYKVGSRLLFY